MNHASSSRWAPAIFGVLTLVIAALITSMLLGYSLADTLGHTHPVLNALRHNMAPVMFVSMVLFLLLGYPVAFALAACGVIFGLIGIDLGMLQPSLFRAMPERLWGVMSNDTLLAIPFFTFMGLILERSGKIGRAHV